MKRLFCGSAFLCLFLALALPAAGATLVRDDAAWYRVHLGTGTGDTVSPEEIAKFIDTFITDRFPEGLTVSEARGQWASEKHGLIRERTTVIDIQCADTDDNFNLIREIADTYIKRYAASKASCFVKRIPGTTTILYYQ